MIFGLNGCKGFEIIRKTLVVISKVSNRWLDQHMYTICKVHEYVTQCTVFIYCPRQRYIPSRYGGCLGYTTWLGLSSAKETMAALPFIPHYNLRLTRLTEVIYSLQLPMIWSSRIHVMGVCIIKGREYGFVLSIICWRPGRSEPGGRLPVTGKHNGPLWRRLPSNILYDEDTRQLLLVLIRYTTKDKCSGWL